MGLGQGRGGSIVGGIVVVVALMAQVAHAEYKAWVLARFADTPEGLAVDAAGNLYTALFHTGQIMKVTPEGAQELIAVVPSEKDAGKGNTMGVNLDEEGNLYVAYKQDSPKYEAKNFLDPFHAACRDATVTLSGVYKIEATTRQVTPLATRRDGWAFCFPNDVAIDARGNIYLTDVTYAGIWKISPDGKQVVLWSAHPLLN
jgi:sugar lactone lactonase YvrE